MAAIIEIHIKRHLDALWQNLIRLYIPQQEMQCYERFKIFLTYLFICSGIVLLTVNAIVLSFYDAKLNSTFDLVAAAIFLILVLWPKKNLTLFIYLGVLNAFALFVLLFAYGGLDRQGFIWSYTFPLFTFFLLGCRNGTIVNILFFLCCSAIIQFDLLTNYLGMYDFKFAFRFSGSFILVFIFSLFYEFFRHKTEKLSNTVHENLETLVAERTIALKRR